MDEWASSHFCAFMEIGGKSIASCLPSRPNLNALSEVNMLYAMLCYNNEETVFAWSKDQNDAVMDRLASVEEKLKKQGRLGPTARLMPTSAATTLRKQTEPPLVIDGPFAETKEQLLGFFIIECVSLDEAVDTAKELGQANPGGSYEIRPLLLFKDNKVGS